MDPVLSFALYAVVMALIWAGYAGARRRHSQRNRSAQESAQRAGLAEPASLHPLIDPARCIGCGSCVEACPERTVLGLIEGKAALIQASHCIGHGACARACPTQAIVLVFGTAKRGVDIPLVQPNFETQVPGLFIAGELGGMGLIRNAIEQGRQAIDGIRALAGMGKSEQLDVVIVGAGPAGFSATLAAKQHGLRARTIEQDSLGGTVAHFPRGKLVMTAPAHLPLVGLVKFKEISKEALLSFWEDVQRQQQLDIHYQERLETLRAEGDDFIVTTSRGEYRSRAVLLAIGRRGTPRTLDVPGEHLPKVVYRLIDAEQYRGQHILVVGGGDSALEAACACAEQPDTQVSLSYRGDGFSRAKAKNRERVQAAQASGRLTVLLPSTVIEILPQHVRLEYEGQVLEQPNDAVIVCVGGVLPTPFLKSLGVEVETKHGTV